MTTRKDPKTKAQPAERRDDLALDPETVKDLDPHEKATAVRGGSLPRLASLNRDARTSQT